MLLLYFYSNCQFTSCVSLRLSSKGQTKFTRTKVDPLFEKIAGINVGFQFCPLLAESSLDSLNVFLVLFRFSFLCFSVTCVAASPTPLCQLACRAARRQVIPLLTMHLLLMKGCDSNSRVLQTDSSTLLHLISTLEAALATMKTSHARRILRNIK